jgi:aminopeptidase-like protein
LPVGSLTRTPHGEFPQYHTSADNLEFVRAESLGDSLSAYINIIRLLEQNKKYVNQNAKCEPQLGKRGIYRAMGGQLDQPLNELAMLWVLNLSDGAYSLLDIATRSGLPFETIQQATDVLVTHGLLKECDEL